MSHTVRISIALLVLALGLGTSAALAAPGSSGDVAPIGSQPAERQRTESSPELVARPADRERAASPTDRYDLAGGCYLVGTEGGWLRDEAGTLRVVADRDRATPLHFQATELGRYLLFGPDKLFVARSGDGVGTDEAPSRAAEWWVEERGDGFVLVGGDDAPDPSRGLTSTAGAAAVGEPAAVSFRGADGCATWEEIEVNVSGPVFAGTSPLQEVRGYLDDHIHHMTQDFLGGSIHCGQPWHPYGVKYALVDCPDHSATLGKLALPEIVLSGKPEHDHVGWPTFTDWPAYDSLTHEGTYYKWVERAWRGGQRLWVNLLVENTVLCAIYPGDNTTCTDMDSIRLQAEQSRQFENYVDAQWGGPGEGWYRIVKDPAEARAVINDGKLAVVLGTESSDIFGCSIILDSGSCDEAKVRAGLDELHALGVRQMVPTHKFDNAFSGTKGDGGFNGIATNLGNFVQTGDFLDMQPCEDGAPSDNAQLSPAEIPEENLARFVGGLTGLLGSITLPARLPLYSDTEHQCNQRGLTEMGRFMIDEMVARNIIYDVDHMSAKGRDQALSVFEDIEYAGVISSHSWSDPSALPRIYALGGMVNPYAGASETFVDQWRGLLEDMDGRFYWGLGFGADTNGLGAQGGPRGADVDNPVEYPFEGMGGTTIDHQHSGERVYDINVDGVAHYGLYPDWIEDLQMIAGESIDADLVRGPEAYLQMWERAEGVANDACREPALRRQVSEFAALRAGTESAAVLQDFGQPHQRRDDTYRYCALDGDRAETVTVHFDGTQVAAVTDSTQPDGGTDGGGGDDGVGGTGTDGAGGTGGDADPVGAAPAGPAAGGDGQVDLDAGGLPEAGGPALTQVLASLLAVLVGAAMVASTLRLRRSGG